MDLKVAVGKLRIRIDPAQLCQTAMPFVPIDFVGQPRAQRALELALAEESRFHALLVGEDLSLETVREYLENGIAKRQWTSKPLDYCYVYNFQEPESPRLLTFPAGEGDVFKSRVKTTRDVLQGEIPPIVMQAEERKQELYQSHFQTATQQTMAFLKKVEQSRVVQRWRQEYYIGMQFSVAPGGELKIQTGLFMNDQLITDPKAIEDVFEGNEEIRKRYESGAKEIAKTMEEVRAEISRIHEERKAICETEIQCVENLAVASIDNIIRSTIDEIAVQYADTRVQEFLEGLKQYALAEIRTLFIPQFQEAPNQFGQLQRMQIPFEEVRKYLQHERDEDPLLPFEINVLVDNKNRCMPPIIVAASPTYSSLFGRTDKGGLIYERGNPPTDHTKIKAGALHRANGGFLVIDLTDLLHTKTIVYVALSRTLQENKIRIQEPSAETGISSDFKTLTPEPIPMELKVIAIIKPWLYNLLSAFPFDKRFVEDIFSMPAIFDSSVENTPANQGAFVAWMARYAKNKPLLPMDPEACAVIIEHLLRRHNSQQRFSANAERIKILIKEAYFYAKDANSRTIRAEDVKKALAENSFRLNLYEEKLQEAVVAGIIKVQVDGNEIGQINGLGVWQLGGGYTFGMPIRITANTYRGPNGIQSIQKEAGLADETHAAGLRTLEGFFRQRYGQEYAAVLSATISFEDGYGRSAGPSASAAQLYALMSSLAGKPITQSLAITGTIDQRGNIGAIGGVNEKIEGFFRLCARYGLTGKQGVIIPKANVNNLMLDEELAEAVRNGQFCVYAISRAEEGIELLTGCKINEIDQLINQKLRDWSKLTKRSL